MDGAGTRKVSSKTSIGIPWSWRQPQSQGPKDFLFRNHIHLESPTAEVEKSKLGKEERSDIHNYILLIVHRYLSISYRRAVHVTKTW
jgi:hypothetical protein